MKTMTLKKFLLLVCCLGISSHGFGLQKKVDLEENCLNDIVLAISGLISSCAIEAIESGTGEISNEAWNDKTNRFLGKNPTGQFLTGKIKSNDRSESSFGIMCRWAYIVDEKDDEKTKALKEALQALLGFRYWK